MKLRYKEHKIRRNTIHCKVVLVRIPFQTHLSIMPRNTKTVWRVLHIGNLYTSRQFCQTYDYDPSRN